MLALAALLAVLVAQRHRLVGAIREFSILPGGLDRAAAAAARVRPLLEAELAALGLKVGDAVFLRVLKEESILEVWMQAAGSKDFVHYKTYPLCQPPGELGPPSELSDPRLPEGFYGVTLPSLRPQHRQYLGFAIDYPNALDVYYRRPARAVLVQGDCVGGGALALKNPDMEEVYTLVAAALRAGHSPLLVHLFPFQLTDDRMNEVEASRSPWLHFWASLKEGYDYFEISRRPPEPTAKDGRYCFE